MKTIRNHNIIINQLCILCDRDYYYEDRNAYFNGIPNFSRREFAEFLSGTATTIRDDFNETLLEVIGNKYDLNIPLKLI